MFSSSRERARARPRARKRTRRAFTLLEVLMAVALFGAVVTIILSAQAGLVASNRSAANMSQAIELGRCRMSELEEKQLKLGFPEIEDKDSSNVCCGEQEAPGFSCEWQVERVLLPQPTTLGGEGGLNSNLLGGGLGLGLDAGIGAAATGLNGVPSPIGSVMTNPLGGASLDFDAGLQNIGNTLTQSFGVAGGTSGLLTLVFSLVYPSLKPLLETAIRRVTVTVKWKEGPAARDFTLVQYITNPSRAGLLGAMADAGLGLEGGVGGGTGIGTPGAAGGGPGRIGIPGATPTPYPRLGP